MTLYNSEADELRAELTVEGLKNAQLQSEKDALVARVSRITQAAFDCCDPEMTCELEDRLNETESEALNEIRLLHATNLCCKIIHQAWVVHRLEDFDTELNWLSRCVADAKDQYANQIRQQGKDQCPG